MLPIFDLFEATEEQMMAISKRKLLTPSLDLFPLSIPGQIDMNDPKNAYKYGKWLWPVENTMSVLISLATFEWDHIAIDLEELGRCPTYPEMSKIKEVFWPDSNSIALQKLSRRKF